MLVEQVVAEVAAEVVQGLRHVVLGLGHAVLPDPAVLEPQLGHERVVGVDGVPAVQEDVGLRPAHRLVHAEPAPLRIDAVALAAGVGRPGEDQVARLPGGGAEAAPHGLAPGPPVAQVLEGGAIEDGLARGQVAQVHLGREVGVLERGRARHPAHVGERLGGGPLEEEPRRAIGARPDHAARAPFAVAGSTTSPTCAPQATLGRAASARTRAGATAKAAAPRRKRRLVSSQGGGPEHDPGEGVDESGRPTCRRSLPGA